MNHFFDQPLNRYGTNSYKYDFALEQGKPEDIIPMWVADMDFPSPVCVKEKLLTVAAQGHYGYTAEKGAYFEAIANWYKKRFAWDLKKEWLVKTPGIICAIAAAIRSLTNPGDSILIQPPVYYPFAQCIQRNHRRMVINPLREGIGRYEIDFEDFEQKIEEHQVKLFILCSPHNPVGRVWTKEELCQMGDICVRHHVLIISDEAHSDFVYHGHRHYVLSDLKPEYAELTITCTAPSKTFNLAGLNTSNIFIPNPFLRKRFQEELEAGRYEGVNMMGLAACEAAYQGGALWLDSLIPYLEGNLDFLENWLRHKLPGIHMNRPEGTYLVWLDCRSLEMNDSELSSFFSQNSHVWLDEGLQFGVGGEGHMRMNLACHRDTLQTALERITCSIEEFSKNPIVANGFS